MADIEVVKATGLAPVKLSRGWAEHNAGEIAGVSPEIARKLIAAGIAEPVKAVQKPVEKIEK